MPPKRKAIHIDETSLDHLESVLISIREFFSTDKDKTPKDKSKKKKAKTSRVVGKGVGYGNAQTKAQKKKLDTAVIKAATAEKASDQDASNLLSALCKMLESEGLEDLDSSCATSVVRLLDHYLRNDSLVDIGRRSLVYRTVLNTITFLSRDPVVVSKFFKSPTPSTLALLNKLGTQSLLFKQINSRSLDDGGIDVLGDDLEEIKSEGEDIVNALAVAVHVETTLKDLKKGIRTGRELGLIEGRGKRGGQEDDNDMKQPTPTSFRAVKLVEMIEGRIAGHRFWPALTTIVGSKQKRLLRISTELSTLTTSLPTGIYLRVDHERMDVMKALIIGPRNTPYENGAFVFDLVLPPNYPQEPPKCLLTTTNGNKCRFNPNLYADGKVCLSLLGTWSGEPWNPTTSTLLQVLVSIQSLILVDDPFYNEPGYKVGMSEKESTQYNTQVRAATMKYAILDQIRKPEKMFEDVIRWHFKTTKDLPTQLKNWRSRCREGCEAPQKVISSYQNLVAGGGIISLKAEIDSVCNEIDLELRKLPAWGEREIIELNDTTTTTTMTTTTMTTATTKNNNEVICLDDSQDEEDIVPVMKPGPGSTAEDAIEL